MWNDVKRIHFLPQGAWEISRSSLSSPLLHVHPLPSNSYVNRLVAGFPPRRPRFEPGPGYMGFVVDKVALGQVFSEYFGFLCYFAFHRLLHNHHLSSGAGTIGQTVAEVPSGLRLTPWEKYSVTTEKSQNTVAKCINIPCSISKVTK
jgi:hypothetical protein